MAWGDIGYSACEAPAVEKTRGARGRSAAGRAQAREVDAPRGGRSGAVQAQARGGRDPSRRRMNVCAGRAQTQLRAGAQLSAHV